MPPSIIITSGGASPSGGGGGGGGTVTQGPAGLITAPWFVELSNGTVQIGTPSNPIRTDPTGTTAQPVLITGHAGATLDGTAGSPSTGVITIQGVASGTVVPVSGGITIAPATTGGVGTFIQQALTSSINIKSTAGQVYGFDFFNPNAVTVYVYLYNTATTPGTIGATTNLIYQKGLPAGAGSNVSFPVPIAFSTGIAIAVSTSPTASAAPSTGLVLTTLFD